MSFPQLPGVSITPLVPNPQLLLVSQRQPRLPMPSYLKTQETTISKNAVLNAYSRSSVGALVDKIAQKTLANISRTGTILVNLILFIFCLLSIA